MSDYRDLDWELFTGHMFSKKELDEIYEQGRADEKNRIEDEIVKCHNDSGMIEIQKVINIIEQVRGGE